MEKTILVGAVAYDPRVVPIWEGMRDYFQEAGVPIDYVLYSCYDSLVRALLERQIDIAWNTNLAWVKVHRRTNGTCRALGMRDVDARFTSVFVARTDAGIHSLSDLRGKRLALGSADSAQAAILPMHFLRKAGLAPRPYWPPLDLSAKPGHRWSRSGRARRLRAVQRPGWPAPTPAHFAGSLSASVG